MRHSMHLCWLGNHRSRQVWLISIAAWNGLIIRVSEISSNFLLYSRDFRQLKAVFSPFNPFLLTTVVSKKKYFYVFVFLSCTVLAHTFKTIFSVKSSQGYKTLLHQTRPCIQTDESLLCEIILPCFLIFPSFPYSFPPIF